MTRIDKSDLLGGLLVALVGLYFLVGAFDYEIGTLTRMGPGFLPASLGAAGLVLGLAIMALATARPGDLPATSPRALLSVLAAIAAFGLLLERAGLMPAAFVAVVLATYGDPDARRGPTLILAVLVAVGTWLVFSLALGLPMRAFELP